MDIDFGDSLSNFFNSFLGLLPNIIGALVILGVGGLLLVVGPWLLLRGWIAKRPPAEARTIEVFVWAILLVPGLVVLSLAISTLGIDSLTGPFNEMITALPSVIIAALLLVVGFWICRQLFRFGRQSLNPRLVDLPGGVQGALRGLGHLPMVVIGFLAVSMAFEMLFVNYVVNPIFGFVAGSAFGIGAGHWPPMTEPTMTPDAGPPPPPPSRSSPPPPRPSPPRARPPVD